MKTPKIEKYTEAPYKQGYDQAFANQKYSNPYLKTEGQEADDSIAIEATKLGDNCVIVSLDKDLDQICGWHYNFVKHSGYYITPEQGLVKLYTQMLTGDAADNIKGLFRVGPVKAAKIIGDTTDELELYNKVLEAYEGDAERVLENAQLLFLRRYEGQIWTPPQT